MGSMTECVGACGRLKYPGRPDVDVWIKLNGCGGVSNGYIRRRLVTESALILLRRVKSASRRPVRKNGE